jgi:hypothetical protein
MPITLNGTTGIVAPAIDVTTPVTVADGGTGLSSVGTSGNVLTSNGTSWVSSALPSSGKILQVVSTTKTSNFSTSSGSYTDITGLSATITPTSTSSRILVISNFFAGGTSAEYPKFKLVRNGSDIFLGDAYGSASRASAGMYPAAQASSQIVSVATSYVDSPSSTSALTYKWQVFTFSGRTIYVGSTPGSADANNVAVPSTITLMEIAA